MLVLAGAVDYTFSQKGTRCNFGMWGTVRCLVASLLTEVGSAGISSVSIIDHFRKDLETGNALVLRVLHLLSFS